MITYSAYAKEQVMAHGPHIKDVGLTGPQTRFTSRDLNPLQRGILQKCLVFAIYVVSITFFSFLLDRLDKYLYFKIIANAEAQGIIGESLAQTVVNIIVGRGEIFFISIILFGILCGLIVFGLMRLTATLQLSWPVVLNEAVEFRQAMEKLGISEPDDRIDFVRKHYVPVYIAFTPITGFRRDKVKARLYAFSGSASIGNRKLFNTYIGSQRLCLAGGDYQTLLENFMLDTQTAQIAKIGTLEATIDSLKGEFSLQQEALAALQKENADLKAENEENKSKLRTLAAREKKLDNREGSKSPFRRVAYPLVNRLIAQASPGDTYTRTQIQDEFMRELESYPDLRDAIRQSLWTQKKAENETPFDLNGWAMEEIRAALADYAQKEPGRKK